MLLSFPNLAKTKNFYTSFFYSLKIFEKILYYLLPES